MKKTDLQDTFDDQKAKVRPYVLPTTTLLLALSAAYYYGKNKGAIIVSAVDDSGNPVVKHTRK